MNIKALQGSAQKFVADNATVILTAGGVVGTVATGVLAWRSGYTTAQKIWIEEENRRFNSIPPGDDEEVVRELKPVTTKDKVVMALPTATPAVVIAGGTIAAIVFSHRMSAQKAAALAAAYGISQKQFEEYKAKVAEKLTPNKQQQVNEELAQDRVNNADGSSQIIITGSEIICFDEATGRFFNSTMDHIQRASNATNGEILHHGYASADFFYSELKLEPTLWTEQVGWDSPFKLVITTTMTPDHKPCLSFGFSKLPHPDYTSPHYS